MKSKIILAILSFLFTYMAVISFFVGVFLSKDTQSFVRDIKVGLAFLLLYFAVKATEKFCEKIENYYNKKHNC
jgi:putative Mn2+ efflux pump MntP